MNFKELRQQKNNYKKMLGIANNTVKQQIDEIDTLNRVVSIQEIELNKYKVELQEIAEIKTRIEKRIKYIIPIKNHFYKNWIKQVEKTNKIKKYLYLSLALNVVTTIFLFWK